MSGVLAILGRFRVNPNNILCERCGKVPYVFPEGRPPTVTMLVTRALEHAITCKKEKK